MDKQNILKHIKRWLDIRQKNIQFHAKKKNIKFWWNEFLFLLIFFIRYTDL
jgi:hypothetical protein